jgi:hypothetical protein
MPRIEQTTVLTDNIHSIGNLLGEGKARRAGVVANTSIVLAMLIALFFSTLFLIFRKSWARMFNDDPGAFYILFREIFVFKWDCRGRDFSGFDHTPRCAIPSV